MKEGTFGNTDYRTGAIAGDIRRSRTWPDIYGADIVGCGCSLVVATWRDVDRVEMAGPPHEVSAFEPSPSAEPLPFGDFDRWRSTGCDLVTGGEVEGEAVSAGSDDSRLARALHPC